MIQVKIEERGFDLNQLSNALNEKTILVANVRAINVAIRKANTKYRRLIVGQYNLKYADTNKFALPKLATYGNVTGTISGPIAPISLSRFSPTFKKAGNVFSIKAIKDSATGQRNLQQQLRASSRKSEITGVSFEIKKGQPKSLPFAFMIQSDKNAGLSLQIWARGEYQGNKFVSGKSRFPITPLKTVSPFGTMTNPVVVKNTEVDASRNMQIEFERQINLLLNKVDR